VDVSKDHPAPLAQPDRPVRRGRRAIRAIRAIRVSQGQLVQWVRQAPKGRPVREALKAPKVTRQIRNG